MFMFRLFLTLVSSLLNGLKVFRSVKRLVYKWSVVLSSFFIISIHFIISFCFFCFMFELV